MSFSLLLLELQSFSISVDILVTGTRTALASPKGIQKKARGNAPG